MTTTVNLDLRAVSGGKVEINGLDVSAAVAGLTVNAHVGEPTTVLIRLPAAAVTMDGEARVKLAPMVREMLVAAGWTPPVELFTTGPFESCAGCGHSATLHWDETSAGRPVCVGGIECRCDRSFQLVNQLKGQNLREVDR